SPFYALSLHDALPIYVAGQAGRGGLGFGAERARLRRRSWVGDDRDLIPLPRRAARRESQTRTNPQTRTHGFPGPASVRGQGRVRSEEHTSELQSRSEL